MLVAERVPALDTARLVFLGTASADPPADRFLTSLAVQVEERVYLLDCGAPVSTLLRRAGWRPLQVARLFISHFHPDHTAGITPLLVQQMMEGRRDALPIVGPPGTSRRVPALMDAGLLASDELGFALPLENAATDAGYGDGSFEVRFFRTSHLSPDRPRPTPPAWPAELVSYGMQIATAGHRVVFSGDVGSARDVEPALQGCTLLIHELAHVELDDLVALANGHAVPALAVTHIHQQWFGREEELRHKILERYHGALWVASDGLTLTLEQGTAVRE